MFILRYLSCYKHSKNLCKQNDSISIIFSNFYIVADKTINAVISTYQALPSYTDWFHTQTKSLLTRFNLDFIFAILILVSMTLKCNTFIISRSSFSIQHRLKFNTAVFLTTFLSRFLLSKFNWFFYSIKKEINTQRFFAYSISQFPDDVYVGLNMALIYSNYEPYLQNNELAFVILATNVVPLIRPLNSVL